MTALLRPARALALALLIAAAGGGPLGPTAAAAKGGTESLADLAASVVDAVVNISASQVVEQKTAGAAPKLPQDAPFHDLFEDFFKRQLEGRNGAAPPDTPHARRSNSLGSGFIIDPAGIIVTNNHVIEGANEIIVILTDGRRLKAEVVGKDSKVDVAVLTVKADRPLKPVPFGDSDKMRVGDAVMAVGNPFDMGGTVTAGIVSARNRKIDSGGPYDNYIQTDAAINRGNSGGPLFNMAGEVIGINTAILSPTGGSIGIGFATPANTVLPIINQLREFHETRRGWLGARIQPVDEGIAESLGLGAPRGALIAGVDEAGPAKPAGLKAGDIILSFDGKDVTDSRDLPGLVAATPVGKEVAVGVFRDGKTTNLTVKLGRLEEAEKVAAADPKAGVPAVIASETALGMSLSMLNDDLRKKFAIKDTVKGVVVTAVEPDSAAAAKGIKAGEVVAEINQEQVSAPADITLKLKTFKDAGKKTALLLVSNGQGEVRFVAVGVN